MHPSCEWLWLRVGVTEKRFVKVNYRVGGGNATPPIGLIGVYSHVSLFAGGVREQTKYSHFSIHSHAYCVHVCVCVRRRARGGRRAGALERLEPRCDVCGIWHLLGI